MKRLALLFSISIILLSSCEVIILEEPIPVIINEDSRDYFVGYFDVEEYSRTTRSYTYYTIRIYKASRNNNLVIIENFYGLGIDVIAEVDGDYLYFIDQDVNDYHIEGEGSLQHNELRLNYSVYDHINPLAVTDICESVAIR